MAWKKAKKHRERGRVYAEVVAEVKEEGQGSRKERRLAVTTRFHERLAQALQNNMRNSNAIKYFFGFSKKVHKSPVLSRDWR